MGVEISCEVCRKFIRSVEVGNVESITGDEICNDCDRKIQQLYVDLDGVISKYRSKLDNLFRQARLEIAEKLKEGTVK